MQNPEFAMPDRGVRHRGPANRTIGLATWWIVVIMLGLCALTGGSARADAVSLLVLRPALIVAGAALLLVRPAREPDRIRTLWWLFAAWALCIAVQLAPLPPGVWTALPGRAWFAQAAPVGGFAPGWHGITLSPDLTWNSLLALLPAAFVLAAIPRLSSEHRSGLIAVLAGLAFLDVAIAILQTSSGSTSPLYFYQIANRGAPTGFFANRNHNAIFLVAMLPILDAWLQLPAKGRERRNFRIVAVVAVAAAIAMLVLISGSRIGLVLAAACVAVLAMMHFRTIMGLGGRLRLAVIAGAGALVAGLILLTIFAGRALSIDRLMGGPAAEARVVNLPTIGRIIREMFPFGSGFGTFDPVFRAYEPDAVLKPTYLNNAHNDLLEVAMTGGLPALIVLAAFAIWFVLRVVAIMRSRDTGSGVAIARAAALAIALLLAGSLSDYPLRTPFLTAFFALNCILLEIGVSRSAGGSGKLQRTDGAAKDRPASPMSPR